MKVQKKSREVHRDPIGEMARGSIIHERGLVQEEPKPLRGYTTGYGNRLFDAKIGHVEDSLSLLFCAPCVMRYHVLFNRAPQESHDAPCIFYEPKGFYPRMIRCSFGLRDSAQHTEDRLLLNGGIRMRHLGQGMCPSLSDRAHCTHRMIPYHVFLRRIHGSSGLPSHL
jgi:hypothetical protein